jgi:GTP-binding protein
VGIIPAVAIVGRPNVGKSSMFNRFTRERIAVVADEPGTTRDRVTAFVTHDDRALAITDTGGLVLGSDERMVVAIREQVESAVLDADLLLFVVDVTSGILPADEEVAAAIRVSGKPVVLVANKADNFRRERLTVEFYGLGMGEPFPISAHHDMGFDELWIAVMDGLPEPEAPPELPEGAIPVAIVGRPNVGKSSLVNAILGEDRVVVDSVPGTTRDAVDTPFEYAGQSFVLIDTAGMRRRGHITPGVERFSVSRAMQAIERADMAALVVDATEYITAQDLHVAGYVQDAFKGMVLVVNKWDLADEQNLERLEVEGRLRRRLKFFPNMPIVFTSALEGKGVTAVLDAVTRIWTERNKRIATSRVNRALIDAIAAHPPPAARRRRLQIYYATQAEVNPPTFVFFTNDPSLVHFSYRRYLENVMRKNFGFHGTAIRIVFRGRNEMAEARAS